MRMAWINTQDTIILVVRSCETIIELFFGLSSLITHIKINLFLNVILDLD